MSMMMRMTSEECSLLVVLSLCFEPNLLHVIHPLLKLVTVQDEPVSFSFEDHAGAIDYLNYMTNSSGHRVPAVSTPPAISGWVLRPSLAATGGFREDVVVHDRV